MKKSGAKSSSPPATEGGADSTAELSEQLRRKSEHLRLLSEVVRTANSLLEPDAVIGYIVDRVQHLVQAEAWSLLLVDESDGHLYFREACGQKAGPLKDVRIPPGEGIAGTVAATGLPMVVNDAAACPSSTRSPTGSHHSRPAPSWRPPSSTRTGFWASSRS